ncbi:hypothetical protein AVEN_173588-1 [Araneus ventricosus]|uniref:Uncharacterized protein n=1 Tax=Araneus ventricosus TaxID=182803 RepID=A0A4Y2CQY1_ARAVE|nr:hypothetical protein AVEN_173588-1 [Araneus ventricosus]
MQQNLQTPNRPEREIPEQHVNISDFSATPDNISGAILAHPPVGTKAGKFVNRIFRKGNDPFITERGGSERIYRLGSSKRWRLDKLSREKIWVNKGEGSTRRCKR